MDPRAPPASPTPDRLPRTRGDGPGSAGRAAARRQASPHTRGWTRVRARHRDDAEGFPAHAGMDPARILRGCRPSRLPRTRGDGPVGVRGEADVASASPHTRGWTSVTERWLADVFGFPAHAGMDPPPGPRGRTRARLPRTRGDGPDTCCSIIHRATASPHTRGWTLRAARAGPRRGGFPAHAGMDPSRVGVAGVLSRLPRTRGDGPLALEHHAGAHRASPHTRGWTRRHGAAPLLGHGFPAHAGMDPRRAWLQRLESGLPRTRGDGPLTADAAEQLAAASPHTRGWTRPRPGVDHLAGGFPAHAGMDPTPAHTDRPASRLPRTRGDGPNRLATLHHLYGASPHTRGWTQQVTALQQQPGGFPAHAGMDPGRRRLTSGRRGLPRTRGDGPVVPVPVHDAHPASPHTRGWTRPRRRRSRRHRGFPAHAGMDPKRLCRWPSPDRLPRTRGDGPMSARLRARRREASPHTRGWTRGVRGEGRTSPGFPAHAGMDPPPRRSRRGRPGLPRTRGDGP